MDDLAWPRGAGSKSLVALALAHGVGVSTAHRALTDCLLIAHTLERLPELGVVDVKAFLRRGLRPKAKFRALVSYETNSLAKAAGFRWEPNARMWTRTMAVEDVAGLPFKAVPVDADAVQAVA
jgi:DNA polymerase-3 subunit epsilon